MRRESAAVRLKERALDLIETYESTGDVRTLRRAVKAFRDAAAATPAGHPDRAARLSNHGAALQALHEATGDPEPLERAVELARDAVAAAAPHDPERPMYLGNLCAALLARHGLDEDPVTVEAAIDAAREAVAAEHPDQARYFSDLSEALLLRYAHDADLPTLVEAVDAARLAVDHAAQDDPDRGTYLSDLGLALRTRYERDGVREALEEAILVGRAAVACVQEGDARTGVYLCNLSATLLTWYESTGEEPFLHEALHTGRAGLAVFAADDPDRAAPLSNVAAALQALYETNGDHAALAEAIAANRAALSFTEPGDPLHAVYLTNLSLALLSEHIRTGAADLLREGVAAARAAVADTVRRPDRIGYLTNLSNALRALYERSGDVAVLREAVSVSREAATASEPDDPGRAGRLANLCGDLAALHEHTGNVGALEEAVRVGREAVAITVEDHPNLGGRLQQLCSALRALSERRGDASALEEAIAVGREAVAVTPLVHPDKAMRLAKLSTALQLRYVRSEDESVLRELLGCQREMVALTPEGHVDRAGNLMSVSLTFQALQATQFAAFQTAVRAGRIAEDPEHRPDLDTLDRAIRFAREALESTAPDGPFRALCATVLAVASHEWYRRTGSRTALDAGLRNAVTAFETTGAPSAVRASAAKLAASMAVSAEKYDEAAVMAEQAVELLPQVATRDLAFGDRVDRIADLAGLPSSVAVAMIEAGKPERALALLEKSRGVQFADALDIRSDLTELRRREPRLATEFDDLRQAIGIADRETPGTDYQQLSDTRIQLRERWQALLGRIRAVPDIEGFLVPPTVETLRTAAESGPIVHLIAHEERGYALIVVNDADDPVRVVKLDNLTVDAATLHAADLDVFVRSAGDEDRSQDERDAAQREILRVLGWLWDEVTEPVLRHLGHAAPPAAGQAWPRVWWCPVGVVASLPLHAAGHHLRQPHTDTVLDRVISSYTPTVRALLHARAPRGEPDARSQRVLIVPVPDASETRPLPAARQEADLVRQLISDATVLPRRGKAVLHDDVLAELPRHRIAHFACHCVADSDVPGNSRLLLHDHAQRPLTVTRISELHLANAGLAYLSACGTADTNIDHADEATHLMAAFHLAGYRAVIGSLWPVNDTAGAVIAYGVYSHLSQRGTVPPDPAVAAEALHRTVRRSRGGARDVPTRWAAHIHMGA
ncbi:CHAT domain-containing protein [Lentzea sp. NPDC058436]|uniref:CHAT domain-containing protein n=1 Tax=Lentzea sp. NPDC058436 TaxID=3346499 RepID=UPI0036582F91